MAIAVAVIRGGCAAWGRASQDGSLLNAGTPVRVAVLQANIAQQDKWNPTLADKITNRYIDDAAGAGEGRHVHHLAGVVYAFYFEQDLLRGSAIRRLAVEGKATLLIGSDQVEPVRAEPNREKPEERVYNAAFVVKPDGRTGAVYRKMHLVPFGEYVPAQRLLFFVGPIVEAVSAFAPGTEAVLLPVGDHQASTAICYEVIFASLMRQFVVNGSELLTTITNDAWYGSSSAPYQHWDQAAMRSIENGRYLARAANTGISGFVDPYGRVIEKTPLFAQALLVADLRFLTARTIYTRLWRRGGVGVAGHHRGRASGFSASRVQSGFHAGPRLVGEGDAPDGARLREASRSGSSRAWHSSWTNSFAGIRIWRAAPATCGATFDAAHPADELKTIEERVALPDFWKDQAAAQKLLQRRRRLEEDRDLSESLAQAARGSHRARRMGRGRRAGRRRSRPRARRSLGARSTPAKPRRCSAASTTARTPSSPFIRAPAAPSRRTGPRCCCGCTSAGPSARASSAR